MEILYMAFYVLLALASVFILFYRYVTSTYSHWKARGVPYIKPSFPFGNLGDTILGRKSLIDLTLEQYRQFPAERFFGIFNLNKPVLVLRDPSLIERVLITDFTHFCNRSEEVNTNNDMLAFYLGNLQGDTWRKLRHKLSGAFSHSKLKQMTEQINICGNSIISRIRECELKKEPIMADRLTYLFSQKVIASCAFGIAFDHDWAAMESFIKHAKKLLFNMKVVHIIILSHMYIPNYSKLLFYIPAIAKVVEYFKNLTAVTIQVRQESRIKRNDFLQILLDMKEEEVKEMCLQDSEIRNRKADLNALTSNQTQKASSFEKELLLSDRCITSQLFIFLCLGMEMSAVAILFLLLDLASNPDVQQRVQLEVDEAVKNYGELSYEALHRLNYLDTVIQESSRIKPGFPYLVRVCQSTYKIPGSDLVLEKGDTVLIPSFAVQLDPQNYPDPEHFNPDRFIDNHYKPSATCGVSQIHYMYLAYPL